MCEKCHVLSEIGWVTIWPGSACPFCGARTGRPMLIRPTLLKDFRHRVWKEVWRTTGRLLAGAKRWVFVGYSLPMADVWMLRLLAQSVRSGGHQTRKIEVVDLNPDTFDRYRLLFPEAIFQECSFHDWLTAKREKGGI